MASGRGEERRETFGGVEGRQGQESTPGFKTAINSRLTSASPRVTLALFPQEG